MDSTVNTIGGGQLVTDPPQSQTPKKMEAKLQAIYEAAEVVTKKMYPTLEDLDPKKLDELVHRITRI